MATYLLGADSSGNGNNWTAVNLDITDSVADSPTNNFNTFGAIQNPTNSWSISQGNLRLQSGTSDRGCAGNGYFGGNGGKWYFEVANVQNGSAVNYGSLGIADNDAGNSTDKTDDSIAGGLAWGAGELYHFNKGGYITTRTTQITSGGLNFNTVGDVVMFAVDLDNGKLWYGVNGTWYNSGNPASGTNATFTGVVDKPYTTFVHAFQSGHAFTFNFGQDSSFAGVKTAQGNSDGNGIGDFYYAPPSGFLALSTANLPDPVIDPAQGASPEDHFGTLLWSGDDNATRTIQAGGSGVTGDINFTPDFAWIKRRNGATNGSDHMLLDAVRGVGSFNALSSNGTYEEGRTAAGSYWINFGDIDAFTTDGFTVQKGSDPSHTLEGINQSGGTYVGWNWKANGSGVTNTDGSITSTVSANTTSGFSIVSYTGNGSTGGETYGHGLNQPPELIITKARTTNSLNNWPTWHKSLNANSLVYLNATVGQVVETGWMPTLPSNTLVYLGTGNTSRELTNNSGVDYIAYCFHSVDGFSKFGSYVGNGSADGPFVYTGFRPAWILWKRTDAAQEWHIMDVERNTYNPLGKDLWPPHSSAEYDYGTVVDYTSNGFKLRTSSVIANASGGTYIYMAFAENPFKYSNAR